MTPTSTSPLFPVIPLREIISGSRDDDVVAALRHPGFFYVNDHSMNEDGLLEDLFKTFNFKPKYNIQDGVKNFVEWFKKYPNF